MAKSAAPVKAVEVLSGRLNPIIGWPLGIATWLLPALILGFSAGAFAYSIGYKAFIGVGFVPVFLWTAVYAVYNYRNVGANEYMIMNRLGLYWTIKFPGMRFVSPIDRMQNRDKNLDGTPKKGTLQYRVVPLLLNPDGTPQSIDFRDGAIADVSASLWFRVGKPGSSGRDLRDAILAYEYATEGVLEATIQSASSKVRAELENRTIDDALKNRKAIADQVIEEISDDLNRNGIYLREDDPLPIEDFVPSEATKAERNRRLTAQYEAEVTAIEHSTVPRAIAGMMGKDEDGKPVLTIEQAIGIFDRRENRQTLEKLKDARITLIGPSADGVIKTIGVDQAGSN